MCIDFNQTTEKDFGRIDEKRKHVCAMLRSTNLLHYHNHHNNFSRLLKLTLNLKVPEGTEHVFHFACVALQLTFTNHHIDICEISVRHHLRDVKRSQALWLLLPESSSSAYLL